MGFLSPDRSVLPQHALVIGDKAEAGGSGATYAHIYPGTGEVTREIALANAADVDRAVAAAHSAFPAWRAMPGDKRRDLMLRLAALIDEKTAEMSPLLAIENGSILIASPYMSADASQKFRYFGGWADKIEGRTISTWGGPAHDYVSYEPYGTVGIIVPWNGPLFAATMCMAPALAAGNCIVLKAPENAPWSLMKLMEIIQLAGFPPGVVNLVTGGPDVGEAMVSHPGIGKIEFIGSGGTARKILANAAQNLKPVGLELGGKSAVIVFADADLQAAAKRGLSGAVSANGQGCVNGTRLLVERSIYEPYLQMLQGMAGYVKVGDPLAMDTFMGPVISETALDRIQSMVTGGVAEGGRVVCGGERLSGDYASGFFLPVTVLADVDPGSTIAKNEVFGPVIVVTPFDTEEEAIALANSTDYGLGAYIHTTNLSRAHRVANQMMAGQVQVNGSGEAMTPCVPFGGMKHSGHGRLGGIEGLREFQQVRNVWVNLQD
ncbi:aldehyde dehydrogenase family protein [Novosphingobium album (ex Hu et al. 2023)]|uniref:Aldehyde dehydrogenase family protein n=1 Tax=Novosphingobium album (ex Hu et al. 2023) TaxID=2930093 RepID=A0ABT0B1M5_9SPHN|nr:aldehyde dehydrogenase family protein [Novosphingobium album (ex Hu et al. 2023)]MCJ2178925.1 aldehyde dehydrogenase family protein [Novosphingobium album (ex Hu et al. 2023)]